MGLLGRPPPWPPPKRGGAGAGAGGGGIILRVASGTTTCVAEGGASASICSVTPDDAVWSVRQLSSVEIKGPLPLLLGRKRGTRTAAVGRSVVSVDIVGGRYNSIVAGRVPADRIDGLELQLPFRWIEWIEEACLLTVSREDLTLPCQACVQEDECVNLQVVDKEGAAVDRQQRVNWTVYYVMAESFSNPPRKESSAECPMLGRRIAKIRRSEKEKSSLFGRRIVKVRSSDFSEYVYPTNPKFGAPCFFFAAVEVEERRNL
jgi:hypothetical protein